ERDLVAIDVVDLRYLVDQHVVRFVGVTVADAVRVIHGVARFVRRAVGIFVRAQSDDTGLGRSRNGQRFFCDGDSRTNDGRGSADAEQMGKMTTRYGMGVHRSCSKEEFSS